MLRRPIPIYVLLPLSILGLAFVVLTPAIILAPRGLAFGWWVGSIVIAAIIGGRHRRRTRSRA